MLKEYFIENGAGYDALCFFCFFFFLSFFLTWNICKVGIECVTILLLFYVLVFGCKACGILAP